MTTYAQAADCEAYTEGLEITDPTAFDRLIQRAERDLDYLLGGLPILDSGLKLDPSLLEPWEAEALKRATCAQVEWRLTATEARLTSGQAAQQLKSVEGPDFKKTFATADSSASGAGGQRRFGPKVRQELDTISHLRVLSGRAVAG